MILSKFPKKKRFLIKSAYYASQGLKFVSNQSVINYYYLL